MSTHAVDPSRRTTARTTAAPGEAPGPEVRARSNGGRVGLVALEVATEVRSSLRSPEFAVGAVIIPVILYAMFGLPNDSSLPGGTTIRLAMLLSLSCYGIVTLAIVVFGEDVAKDRGRGWLRTLRATPFPTSVYLTGKLGAALVHGVLIVAAMSVLAATAGGVRLDPAQWAAFGGLMLAGVVVFSPLGFAIAYVAQPRAAAVIANVIFLPLAFASGFFVPLSELPDVMGDIARFLPTYHFGQLVYGALVPAADVVAFTGAATQPVALHLAWVGSALLLTAAALLAARREAVTQRGRPTGRQGPYRSAALRRQRPYGVSGPTASAALRRQRLRERLPERGDVARDHQLGAAGRDAAPQQEREVGGAASDLHPGWTVVEPLEPPRPVDVGRDQPDGDGQRRHAPQPHLARLHDGDHLVHGVGPHVGCHVQIQATGRPQVPQVHEGLVQLPAPPERRGPRPERGRPEGVRTELP
jgi:ABC-2 type transport system permease protein